MPPPHQESSAVAAPRQGPAPSLWIQGPWLDLVLFIGVPLLLVPLILLRPGRPDVQQLILYLGAFGALGHHLPGMLRAYGDRDLLRRFRTRLILAPIFLTTVCVGFAVNGLTGTLLIAFAWTTWHTLMQIFGFARIYDAKVGSHARWTVRLDHALCLAWIGAPLAASDSRMGYILELFYKSGGPLLAGDIVGIARQAWLVGTAVVTLAYALHLVRAWTQGTRPNAVKLLFFAVSFSFWWFCMAAVDHLIVGVALFDIFHDVQYLALVWLVQRGRVEKSEAATGFTRFLFRRSGGLIGLYVGLVIAYGSMGFFTEKLADEGTRNVLLGVLTASALFHFYLDGFIWKVRERDTRESLGIDSENETRSGISKAKKHGLKWALFVIPVGLFGTLEARSSRPTAVWRAAILDAAPMSAEALTNHANDLTLEGRLAEAEEMLRRAIGVRPTHAEAHNNLGTVRRLVGDPEGARASFERAIELVPDYARAHGHLANLLVRMGDHDAAETHFRTAIDADSDYANAHSNLAALLLRRGDARAAVPYFEAAIELEPDNVGALNNLAWLHGTSSNAELRRPARALELAEHLAEVTKRTVPQPLDTLAAAQAASGSFETAAATAMEAADVARKKGNPRLADQIEARSAMYAAGQALQLP